MHVANSTKALTLFAHFKFNCSHGCDVISARSFTVDELITPESRNSNWIRRVLENIKIRRIIALGERFSGNN